MIVVDARNCTIKEISNKIAKDFLDINHSQKYSYSILRYGLYYNNELIQVMTFGKPRFNKNYSWEIIRDCTKKEYKVQGGVSKLWKFFIKNNNVKSCIVYSYPHDEQSLYTNKYVDYCGFKNIKKAKPAKKIYFEGMWNDELKRIDKSILEMHGVDRLLKGNFGHNRTNEQILLDLGFKRKEEDGYEPQVDSYFPYGIVYKITDIDTGKFYIGETTNKEKWSNGYPGSGGEWLKYYNKYKDIHNFKREILKDDFKSPKELYDYELKEIRKYCIKLDNGNYQVDESTGCMNRKTTPQPEMPICPECGAINFNHYKICSKYNISTCSECGGKGGHHKKECSKYKQIKLCPICNRPNNCHLNSCSNSKGYCDICGNSLQSHSHKPWCDFYISKSACEYCGSKSAHKIWCVKSNSDKAKSVKYVCVECKGINGEHKTSCSNYKKITCSECGGLNGNHKKGCSKYKEKTPCKYCGLKVRHKKWCRFSNENDVSYVCIECKDVNGKHLKSCSFYKRKECDECGSIGPIHKKSCSKYKQSKVCEECGGKRGAHKKSCTKYKSPTPCSECGKICGHHTKNCSKYKGR